ncbi:MAG TPA: DUF4162 domain-containing protein, partial [Pseudobacillus sp.]
KNITLVFESEAPLSVELEGVIRQEAKTHELRLLYSGDIQALLKKLSGMPVHDVLIEEPSLEEVFMHYYES